METTMKLTKSKLTSIISFLNSINKICDTALFYNDSVYPVTIDADSNTIYGYSEKINGYNLIEDTLNLTMDSNKLFLYNADNEILDSFKEHAKMTGIKSIELRLYHDEIIYIQLDESEYKIMQSININDVKIDLPIFQSFQTKIDMLMDTIPHWGESTSKDILSINDGNVVIVKMDDDFVRISKNVFPFIGVARTNDDSAFSYLYGFSKCENKDSCVIFIVEYKKFRAIHAFNYIQYRRD